VVDSSILALLKIQADSPTIVAVLKKTLRSAGCVTLEALDAEHGLEIVRREKPDLVFLDIVLPGMTGFAALRQMRRDPLTLHIPGHHDQRQRAGDRAVLRQTDRRR
jgi:CheY-like chemotaxis protein